MTVLASVVVICLACLVLGERILQHLRSMSDLEVDIARARANEARALEAAARNSKQSAEDRAFVAELGQRLERAEAKLVLGIHAVRG